MTTSEADLGEKLPLHIEVEGKEVLNPQLLGFARLYLDEVAEFFRSWGEAKKTVKDELGPDRQRPNVDPRFECERLAQRVLTCPRVFKVLLPLIKKLDNLLYIKIHMNEANEEVAKLYKETFLRPCTQDYIGPKRQRANVHEENEEEYERREREGDFNVDSDVDDRATESEAEIHPGDEARQARKKKKKEKKEKRHAAKQFDLDEDDEGEISEEEETLETAARGWRVADRVWWSIEPDQCLDQLRDLSKYNNLLLLRNEIRQKTKGLPVCDTRPFARKLVRELAFIRPSSSDQPNEWLSEICAACYRDPECKPALHYIAPKYERKLAMNILANREANEGRASGPVDESGMVKEDEDSPKECRMLSEEDQQIFRLEYELAPQAESMHLRGYQIELTKKAAEGSNTVICAPTGSGKTIVAASLIYHHLSIREHENKPKRVVMVVPKIPLVEQQASVLYNKMGDRFRIESMSGDSELRVAGKTRRDHMLFADIVVCTPQILVNCLTSIRREDRLFVADITLLVLDECHHTTQKHPYNELMNIVHAYPHPLAKPQIVGLTASLGVGHNGMRNEDSAIDHIVGLCSRIGATNISTIADPSNQIELRSYVLLPMDEIFPCSRQNTVFGKVIEELAAAATTSISPYLRMLTQRNAFGIQINERDIAEHVPIEATQRYIGRIDMLYERMKSLNSPKIQLELRHTFLLLKMYAVAFATNELLPAKYALKWLKENIELEMERLEPLLGDFKKKADLLREVAKPEMDSLQNKQILQKLTTMVREAFETKKESRIIVFVEKREMARGLAEYINKDAGIRHPKGDDYPNALASALLSSSTSGVRKCEDAKPMPKAVQDQVLESFRRGTTPVIVATSIAEEGLDISACNLIIKYNVCGSVISLVQQRGRARMQGSRSILLVLHESVGQREYENVQAERTMNLCIKRIQEMGDTAFRTKVEATMDQNRREAAKAEAVEQQIKESLQNNLFRVECRDCNQWLCMSSDIVYSSSHYVVASGEFWSKVKIAPGCGNTKYVDMITLLCGRVLCNGNEGNCNSQLGKIFKYHNSYIPTLSSSVFNLRHKGDGTIEQGTGKKGWKHIANTLFYVRKMRAHEMMRMLLELKARQPQALDDLERVSATLEDQAMSKSAIRAEALIKQREAVKQRLARATPNLRAEEAIGDGW